MLCENRNMSGVPFFTSILAVGEGRSFVRSPVCSHFRRSCLSTTR